MNTFIIIVKSLKLKLAKIIVDNQYFIEHNKLTQSLDL